VPATALAPVHASLERAGLLVATEKERFLPARDLAGIELSAVVAAVRAGETGRLGVDMRCAASASRVMGEVEAAIGERLQGRTMKDLIGR
jgi:hypothetical protein